MQTDVIRRISIQAAQIGVAEAAEALKKLSAAQDNVANSQSGAQAANEKYQRQLDISNRQSQQFSAAQRTVAMDLASVRDVLLSVASGVYIVKNAYEAVTAVKGAAESAMGRATTDMMNGARESATYLPGIIAAVWQQGIDKLNQYVELSQKAGALGTDFYQTLTIAATNAKKPADEYLKVVENIGKALERQLGSNGNQNGSAFNSLVAGLQNNGNLQGQLFNVSRVNNSVTGPEQLNAAFNLIKSVLNAGETLVALKLTGTLLGSEAAANLKNDNDYIFKIEQSIKSVQDKDIIKQADVDRAVGMKVELDNAKKVIDSFFTSKSGSFFDFSSVGVEIQQLWVNANSNFAAILKIVDSIFFRSKEIAEIKPDPEGSIWTKIGDFLNDGTLQKLTDATRAYAVAEYTLASRLQNPQNVANAGVETQRAGDLFGDQSRPSGVSAATKDATASILENAAATKLQAENVSRSAGAAAAATAAAQLEAAALKDGLSPEIERLTARYSLLVQAATDAADALDKANKAKAAADAYKAGADSVQSYIEATNLQIKFFGTTAEAAGKLKEAQVNAQLYSLALKEGLTPEQANATVAATGLGKAAGEAATKLAQLSKTPEAKDSYDRATEAVLKYIETTKASIATIDLGAGAQEKARVIAQLTAAGLKDGLTPAAAAAKAEMSGFGDSAGKVADELARVKVASQIDFANKTKFMSVDDVAIAQQLRGIYGNDVPAALASSEAAALRFNNQLKSMNDVARSSATQFTDDLVKGLAAGQTGVEALHSAFKNLSSSLASGALKALFNGDLFSAAVLGISAAISAIFSANTSTSGDKWLKAQTEGMNSRLSDISQRSAMIGVDTNTRQGAIIAQDAEFTRQRIAENKAGGQAMNALLQVQVQERNQLLKDWDQKDTDLVKANADAKLAIEKAAADRSLGFQDRLFAATNDFSTLQGQLAAFDRTAAQDRAKEVEAGGQAIVDLEAAQAAERLGVIKKYNDQITVAAQQAAKAQLDAFNSAGKSVVDYLNNLISGPSSTSSPTDTLNSAKSVYNSNLALAIGGNVDAQSKFPQLADNLEKAARAVYASSQGYQDIKSQIISQGLALPAVQNATDPVVVAMRDVLTAINAGNAAQALDATLQGVIKSAIDAGNAAQVASALLPTMGAQLTFAQFVDKVAPLAKDTTAASLLTSSQVTSLGLANNTTVAQLLNAGQLISALGPISRDTTVGSLLTQPQLQNSGLAANATVGNVQAAIDTMNAGNILRIFQELDGNGNGILEKSEAIASATLYTQGNTYLTKNNVATGNTTLGGIDAGVDETSLAAAQTRDNAYFIKNFSDRIIQALNEQGNMQAGNYAKIIQNGATLLNWMPQLVFNGPGSKAAMGSNPDASIPYSAHATGGVIPAYGLGLVSEHLNPTFLRAGSEPITVSPFAPQIPFNDNGRPLNVVAPAFRGGGGENSNNAALLAEMREMNKKIERLEAALERQTRVTGAVGEQLCESVEELNDTQHELVRETKFKKASGQ